MEEKKLPNKNFYLINEISEFLNIKSFVLRYWETEFEILKPIRTKGKQRRYKKEDIDIIFLIKDLLYNKKYTIAGAKNFLLKNNHYLKEESLEKSLDEKTELPVFIASLKQDLVSLLNIFK
ncbi:MAG: MerR family transcriptional regulator [bacterium]